MTGHRITEEIRARLHAMAGERCACRLCNNAKGLQVECLDPKTGQRVRLFDPRGQSWTDHRAWSADGTRILGHDRGNGPPLLGGRGLASATVICVGPICLSGCRQLADSAVLPACGEFTEYPEP